MNKKTIITALLAFVAIVGQAQKSLPAFQYSKEPAVLNEIIVGDASQRPDRVGVHNLLKYTLGMVDALRRESAAMDADGHFCKNLPTGTTMECHVKVGECRFTYYVVPGQTVSFTFNLGETKKGLAKALTFSGQLPNFNHNFVYAIELRCGERWRQVPAYWEKG